MSDDVQRSFEVENGVLIEDGVWIGGGLLNPLVNPPPNNPPMGSIYLSTSNVIYKKFGPNQPDWEVFTASAGDNNIDGGFANSTYLPDQCFEGGGA